jgi:serine/threonine protein kinase
LKAYQPYGEVADIHKGSQVVEAQDSIDEFVVKKDAGPKKVSRENNLMLPSELSIDPSHAPLQTDPNLSPYSKDIGKLQKLIRFNFRKFNEPPTTTSEFYRIGRVLGRGAFGKVNLAAHKISEQLVAIKSINKDVLRSSKSHQANPAVPQEGEHPEKKKVMQEFAILKQSNHQSVVRLYDTFETSKHICFVMELCAGGDLLTYVRKRRKLAEDVAKYFFK